MGSRINSKAVEIAIPIRKAFTVAVAVYFLNGFQLSSLPVTTGSNVHTPFEVAISGKSSSKTEIVLVISTSSSSQIFSLLISYLAF